MAYGLACFEDVAAAVVGVVFNEVVPPSFFVICKIKSKAFNANFGGCCILEASVLRDRGAEVAMVCVRGGG